MEQPKYLKSILWIALLFLIFDLVFKKIFLIPSKNLGFLIFFLLLLSFRKKLVLSRKNPVDICVICIAVLMVLSSLRVLLLTNSLVLTLYSGQLYYLGIITYFLFRTLSAMQINNIIRSISILVFAYTIIEFIALYFDIVAPTFFSNIIYGSLDAFTYRLNNTFPRPTGLVGVVSFNGPLVSLLLLAQFRMNQVSIRDRLFCLGVVALFCAQSRTGVFGCILVYAIELMCIHGRNIRYLASSAIGIAALTTLVVYVFDFPTMMNYFVSLGSDNFVQTLPIIKAGFLFGLGAEVPMAFAQKYISALPIDISILYGEEVFWLNLLKIFGVCGLTAWVVLTFILPLRNFKRAQMAGSCAAVMFVGLTLFHYNPFFSGLFSLIFWMVVAKFGTEFAQLEEELLNRSR
jgi:hypothetical protein